MSLAPEPTAVERLRRVRETLVAFCLLGTEKEPDPAEVAERADALAFQLITDLAILEAGGQLAEVQEFLATVYGG